MNKTKIEWCDMTWNPVTGCLHNCEYCYACKQSKRFSGCIGNEEFISKPFNGVQIYELRQQMHRKTKKGEIIKAAYPFGFDPTFHRYRLDEPQAIKSPQNIFVVSMGDLFGEWVPDEWIKEVFEACKSAPQHRYLFLTKNPQRYLELEEKRILPTTHFYGTTMTRAKDLALASNRLNTFISIEPLLENFGPHDLKGISWVIIGAENGQRKDKVTPKCEWIENIVKQCRAANVPAFMKDSLIPVVGEENMLREFPWEET